MLISQARISNRQKDLILKLSEVGWMYSRLEKFCQTQQITGIGKSSSMGNINLLSPARRGISQSTSYSALNIPPSRFVTPKTVLINININLLSPARRGISQSTSYSALNIPPSRFVNPFFFCKRIAILLFLKILSLILVLSGKRGLSLLAIIYCKSTPRECLCKGARQVSMQLKKSV